MMQTDTVGGVRHIRRKEHYAIVHTSDGSLPLFKTLCGIEAILSSVDERCPTCKKCIKLRSE